MPDVLNILHDRFTAAITAAAGEPADPLLAVGKPELADYQSNAAMGLAKKLGRKPRDLAEQIAAELKMDDLADEITVAGPGFINVRLRPTWVAQQVAAMLADPHLGVARAASPKHVIVEYSSPNIAKQMHVGHIRSTILGDCIARVLEFLGHDVTRQNHVGDWGTQFGMLLEHFVDQGGNAYKIADLEKFYQESKRRFDSDDDFATRARNRVVHLQSGDAVTKLAWLAMVQQSREHFTNVYDRLKVHLTQTHERGESFYNEMLEPIVTELQASGLAEVSEGATVVFTPPDKAPLMIRKSDGGYCYGTTDLAAVKYRTQTLHADRIIYFVDIRQSQHFRQVFAAASRAGYAGDASLEHAAFGAVNGEGGKPLKTREGGTVKLADLIDEAIARSTKLIESRSPDMPAEQRQRIAEAVGIGAIKYADLSKDRTSDYVFSFDHMISLDGNTGPYLQYAHARTAGIGRKAAAQGVVASRTVQLQQTQEISLGKHLLKLPTVIDQVAAELKPHLLCAYLYDLATLYSSFYESCPVLSSDELTRGSRLALCDATRKTLALGLDLLGIEHPDVM